MKCNMRTQRRLECNALGKFGSRESRASKGFTLIEVIVTVVILTLGLLTILGVFLGAAKSNRNAERIDIASHLGEEVMEQFLNVGYNQIQPFEEHYGDIPNYPRYRRQVLVTDIGTLKNVRILVFFDNDLHHTEFRTFYTNL
jgi:prepilin-type N-terminal cleavage/methylation domain-containing protein